MMQFPSFFLLFFFSYYFTQYTYMFPITLTWHVFATFWVCNYGAILCYYYCYDIVLILHTFFSLHTHESTLQFLSYDIVT